MGEHYKKVKNQEDFKLIMGFWVYGLMDFMLSPPLFEVGLT